MTPEQVIKKCKQNIDIMTLEVEKSPYRALRETYKYNIEGIKTVIDIYEGKNVSVETVDKVIADFKEERLHHQEMLSWCLNVLPMVKPEYTQVYKTAVEWTTECLSILENYKGAKHFET